MVSTFNPSPDPHALVARITATHCCVCRAALTDSESVEHGIGPVCSRRYYNPLVTPSETQVQGALGLLAFAGLADQIVNEFLRAVNNDHTNARKGCNLLIYWASAHYDDRDEVFKCSKIIRALGYTELADKLEIDRSVVSLQDKGDPQYLIAFTPERNRAIQDITRVPGIEALRTSEGRQEKRGSKIGWKVPRTEQAHFECVLGVYFGGTLMVGLTGITTVPRKQLSDLLAFRNPHSASPSQVGNIRLIKAGAYLEIYTPYHQGFITDIRNIQNRKWDPNKKCWLVPVFQEAVVKALILRHYNIPV